MKTTLTIACAIITIISQNEVLGSLKGCSDAATFYKRIQDLKNDLLYGYPKMEAVNKSSVGVFWDHLVPHTIMDCLTSVELRNNEKNISDTIDKDNAKLQSMGPLFQELDICQEGSTKWHLQFSFKDEQNRTLTTKTKEIKYQVPTYFQAPRYDFTFFIRPLYCASETNLIIALFENVVKPAFFDQCFQRIKICNCSASDTRYFCYQCQEVINYRDQDNKIVLQGKFGGQRIKLVYFTRSTLSTSNQAYLNIEQGHCDIFNTEEGMDTIEEENSEVNFVVYLSFGIALFVLMISLGFNCFLCNVIVKNKKQNREMAENMAMASRNVPNEYENEEYDHNYYHL
eukprot:GFUD01014279.1.p1 GENE.GFUD01014279.1~~GFUD01014279.1.p1  ORF type:complete len:342 (+),score=65.81 GFUD01014279.1:68-1093(+)